MKVITTILFSLLMIATEVQAGELSGKISLDASRRLGDVKVTNAVVFFRPEQEIEAEYMLSESADKATMTMDMKAFAPNVISVDTRTEVEFPNADRVIHNAFSTTKENQFDLGFYNQGESRSWTFDQAGLVKVFCNVHQGMVGYVMVMDTPYHTTPDEKGEFRFTNVQPGVGKLFVWHPRGRTFSKNVEIGEDGRMTEVDVSLKLTKRLVPKHKNKFGKPYKRSRDY